MAECPHQRGIVLKHLKLLVCRPEGRLEISKALESFTCLSCFRIAEFREVNRFHDFRAVSVVDLRYDDMKAIAREEAHLRMSLPPIKACYLVSDPAVYGLVRMYQALMAGHGVEVHVSQDIEDLATVLGVNESHLHFNASACRACQPPASDQVAK